MYSEAGPCYVVKADLVLAVLGQSGLVLAGLAQVGLVLARLAQAGLILAVLAKADFELAVILLPSYLECWLVPEYVFMILEIRPSVIYRPSMSLTTYPHPLGFWSNCT